jgi:hypothetical protein
MDPIAEADLGGDPGDPAARIKAGGSLNTGAAAGFGVLILDPSKVVGDRNTLWKLPVWGQPPMRHLGFSITQDGINQNRCRQRWDLNVLNFSSSGWLFRRECTTTLSHMHKGSDAAAPIGFEQPSGFSGTPGSGARPRQPVMSMLCCVSPSGRVSLMRRRKASPMIIRNAVRRHRINVVLFADTDIPDRPSGCKTEFLGQSRQCICRLTHATPIWLTSCSVVPI